jgi:paraquat-inducible protein A
MARDYDVLTECTDCGLIQRIPPVSEGSQVTCPRCGGFLGHVRGSSVYLSLFCAVLGLLLLGLGLVHPAASLNLDVGRLSETDLLQGVTLLQNKGTWELALAVALTLFVFPTLKLLSVALMSVYALRGHAPRWAKTFFATMRHRGGWAMVDVYMLGAMIALFRMKAWGYVWFGPALLALGGAACCTLAIDALMDVRAFWRRAGESSQAPPGASDVSEVLKPPSAPALGCMHCGVVTRGADGDRCPRCEQPLERRKAHSLRRTWAFAIAATVLLVPANVLPVMTVVKMGKGGADTILSGTIELTHHGLWGLAIIVFTASIVVPFLKVVSLAVLLVMTHRGSAAGLGTRTRAYRWIAVIGRWSMIDIFATMTLVAVGRFGWLGHVAPGTGASAFCAVVFLTMFAAEAFDPRLMWDAAGYNEQPSEDRSDLALGRPAEVHA